MRLIDFGQAEAFKPIERGEALPQFYENEDKFVWHNPMDWNWKFWHFTLDDNFGHPTDDTLGMLLAGGEL